MAKWIKGTGLDDYISQLNKLKEGADRVIKLAVYDGAGVVADQFRAAIEGIPASLCTDVEKEGLLSGLTIAPFQNRNGVINTVIGEAGYNDYVTKKYPQGHPNAMVARSINAGTSFRPAYPFIRRATTASKAKAEEVMKSKVESEIEKLMK